MKEFPMRRKKKKMAKRKKLSFFSFASISIFFLRLTYILKKMFDIISDFKTIDV
jgi:hypothetical protein